MPGRAIARLLAAVLPLLGSAAALAQEPAARLQPTPGAAVVDRIVAVVGTRALLASQVEEQFFNLVSSGRLTVATPDDSARARREILQQMVDDELLVQQAQRDTAVTVTEQEVADSVEKQVRAIRARFSGEPDFRAELAKAGFQSADEYRRFVADDVRRYFFRSRLQQKLVAEEALKPLQPTEPEMRAYFDEQKGGFGRRPETIGFRQLVLTPQPAPEAKARAKALADSITAELRRGADFATAARRFSADPGSKERGGDLGWARRGQFVLEFERAVFSTRPGTITDPVESPFGYHIIEVLRTQPGEVQARHILIDVELTEADADSARALADRLAALVRSGASFDSLQALYHDRTEEREAPNTPVQSLPPVYAEAIGDAQAGTLVGPFPLGAPGMPTKHILLNVTERRQPEDIRFEDVRDQIRSRLGEELALRKYLDRLRRATFVEVRAAPGG